MGFKQWLAGGAAALVALGGLGIANIAEPEKAHASGVAVLIAPPLITGVEAATAAVSSGGAAVAAPIGIATAAGNVVVVGGLALGYGIGWAGVQAATWTWDQYKVNQYHNGDTTHECMAPGWKLTASITGSWAQFECGGTGERILASTYVPLGEAFVERCIFADGTVQTYPDDGTINNYGGAIRATIGCRESTESGSPLIALNLGRAYITVAPQSVPTRIRRWIDCTGAAGDVSHFETFVNDISYRIMMNGSVNVPAMDCPQGYHVVGAGTVGENVAPDGTVHVTPGDSSLWTPDPRWTDPTDPYANCMSAATQACTLTPTVPGRTDVDWSDVDPSTGIWTNPVTGETSNPGPCNWGAYVLPASSCYPNAPAEPGSSPGGSGGGGGGPQPPAPPASCDFAPGDADTHYDKHVRGLDDDGNPTLTPDMPEYDYEDGGFEQYVRDAQELLCGDQVGNLQYDREYDGAELMMDPYGRFGIVVGNRITTFFKPTDPANYWFLRTGKDVPVGFLK